MIVSTTKSLLTIQTLGNIDGDFFVGTAFRYYILTSGTGVNV